MQNSRQPKWDWKSHFPRMLDLYNNGHTIPQIHDAIQSDNFKPSQRAVYYIFKRQGYSTGHDRWPESQYAGSPKDSEAGDPSKLPQPFSAAWDEGNIPRAEICVPLQADTTRTSTLPDTYVRNDDYLSQPASQCERVSEENWESTSSFDPIGFAEEASLADSEVLSSDGTPSIDCASDRAYGNKRRNFSDAQEMHEQAMQHLRQPGPRVNIQQQQHGGGRRKYPDRMKDGLGHTKNYLRFKKLRSLLLANPPPMAHTIQEPLFADDDSGYHTGRATSSTHYTESVISEVESLSEFSNRVICNIEHLPPFPLPDNDIQRCSTCGFSQIHHLAWVGRDLGLAEFKAGLPKDRSLCALDAAGNSALHYAAASGASYAHLKALLDAGVPRDQRNTANQNFLHCLRPGNLCHDGLGLDCFGVSLLELLSLLVEPRDFLTQQDNDGKTVLHALALHMNKPRDRLLIFNTFSQLQLPPIILDRFGQSAKNIAPESYPKFPLGLEALDTFDAMYTSGYSAEALENSGWRTIDRFSENPRYMDKETKDTIVHAISRVNAGSKCNVQGNDIIHYLQIFAKQGERLNWYNRDGHHPLSALVCNQTMALYIDHLLWKDPSRHARTNINVDMMNRRGATALYEAAIRAQLDCVRSLIEAGANVNARLDSDPAKPNILKATLEAQRQAKMKLPSNHNRHLMFEEVIKQLKRAGAVPDPTSFQVRGRPK